ncbi:MAG: hypothetical protein SPK85_02080 [Prevotella sp.]|nr:hypothetical protein [Prevotella sp.]
MKKLLFISMLFMGCLAAGVLTSCGGDDDSDGGGGVSGYYAAWYGVCSDGKTKYYRVFHILGSNSLNYYKGVAEKYADDFTKPFPGKSGWYYSSSPETLIYTIKDNQLFVPELGSVFIISNNGKTLSSDGTDYTKIN